MVPSPPGEPLDSRALCAHPAPVNLDLAITPRGRAAEPLGHRSLGPLAPADVKKLDERRTAQAAPPITQIRARHHAIARLIAEGRSHLEVSAILGNITPTRISQLSDDPAFAELVSFYINAQGQTFIDAQSRMHGLLLDTLEVLQDRMDDPDAVKELSQGVLLQQYETLADRTGHGKQTKSTNVNVNIGLAGRLEEARKRMAQTKTIEGTVIDG